MTPEQRVLKILNETPNRQMEGRALRTKLNEGKWFWQRYSAPGFYMLMARMQDKGMISYKEGIAMYAKDAVKLRIYRPTERPNA